MKIIKRLLFISIMNSFIMYSQNDFKIVYVADYRWNPQHPMWLDKITSDWSATGICLQVFWGDVEKVENKYNWKNFDNVMDTITSRKYNRRDLDIYIRVCMGIEKPLWVTPNSGVFEKDDFQIKYDGSLYNHFDYESGPIYKTWQYPLNFTSPNSVTRMETFFDSVLQHINQKWNSKKNRIKEIIPTFSANDEQEYPNAVMCGYSAYEMKEFQNYLRNKYLTISVLNNKWNMKFVSFSNIDAKEFNWWELKPFTEYLCEKGRVDWINFRTERLSLFINALADICSKNYFKMGAQIGSLYDAVIENRGWVDPTKLFEKVNSIHTADIYQYKANFNFAANYVKSLSQFWEQTNDRKISFSTETNWPGFNNQSANFLQKNWKEQLKIYFEEGASEIFLVGWDKWNDKLDSLKYLYDNWCTTLDSYRNKPLFRIEKKENAVHIGFEKILYDNHNQMSDNGRFTIYDSIIITNSKSFNNSFINDDDMITNYMIEKNPLYLNNYKVIYFTESSQYITEKAYNQLFQNEIIAKFNAPANNSNSKSKFIQGLKNEYGEIRSPEKLLLRTTNKIK